MFNKIHYAFYQMLFKLYGRLGKYYWNKAKTERALDPDGTKWLEYEQKAWKYIDAREDILEIEFALKGLI